MRALCLSRSRHWLTKYTNVTMMSSRMWMPSGDTKSDADDPRFRALREPCNLCKKVATAMCFSNYKREHAYLWSIIAYLPLVYAAILSLELLRTEKRKIQSEASRRRTGFLGGKWSHSRCVQTCLRHFHRSCSDDHPGSVVRISRPFYDTDF